MLECRRAFEGLHAAGAGGVPREAVAVVVGMRRAHLGERKDATRSGGRRIRQRGVVSGLTGGCWPYQNAITRRREVLVAADGLYTYEAPGEEASVCRALGVHEPGERVETSLPGDVVELVLSLAVASLIVHDVLREAEPISTREIDASTAVGM